MAGKSKAGVQLAVIEEPGDAGLNESGELVLSASERVSIQAAEDATRKRLQAEPLVEVVVPRNIAYDTGLVVAVNGVALTVPIGRPTKIPASLAALVRARVDHELAREAKARANHAARGD